MKPFLSLLFLLLFAGCAASGVHSVTSPNGELVCRIEAGTKGVADAIYAYSVTYKGQVVVAPSTFRLEAEGVDFAGPFTVENTELESVTSRWHNRFGQQDSIPDNYTQLTLFLSRGTEKLRVICRAYNEGVAFAYQVTAAGTRDSLTIIREAMNFALAPADSCWATYTAQGIYNKIPVGQIKDGCERPLVVESAGGITMALAEAQLVDFARMKFGPDTLLSHAVVTQLHGPVVKALPFQSPWRVVMVAPNAAKLLEQSYLLENLNPPSAIADDSWIKPGKALRETTLTTKGALSAIDFVAQHGMQYVEFDAGWYGPENSDFSDATTPTLDEKRSKGPFDLPRILSYSKEKGVGIILYVNRQAIERQLDTLLPLYRDWGVAGIKYGFVSVGNQKVTRWLHEAVAKTAQYGMIVDIHDEYRPTGFSRTYPNLLTQEGIRGDEESIPNSHTLITMFTRMLAGAADNTVCYYNSRVTAKMGSHASQLAKTVCLFSPLQFLYWYDKAPQAPVKSDGLWGDTSTIGEEPELEFFDKVPTVWNETRVLHADIGKCGVIARRNGSNWFIGAINSEQPRALKIAFDFLEPGKSYKAKFYSDDPSVETRTHVRIDEKTIESTFVYDLSLGSNKGVAVMIEKI
ncbi:MAG: glycoside hydrolase family 97 catalytic domain-containing protein [Bacteroidales bacterium]